LRKNRLLSNHFLRKPLLSHPRDTMCRMGFPDLVARAERQLGLVSTHQAHHELARQRFRTAVANGSLVRVRTGVYRFAGTTMSWRHAVMAAVLVAGLDDAWASHGAAAAVHGLAGFRMSAATAIDISVRRGTRPRLKGIAVHECAVLPTAHVTTVDDVPVTSVARTVCDLAGTLPEPRLARVVDDALVRKLTTMAELRQTYEALRGGRRSIRAIGRILAVRGDEAARADSLPEAQLVRWLREAGLPEPEQQHRIDAYRIDLAYPSCGLLVEYDGFEAHTTRSAFDADRRRQNALVLHDGLTVLRFTSASTREEVVRDVSMALARRAA
jgi:very-short-patch-repair endonuclease